MNITWKDGITTLLVLAAYGVYYAMKNAVHLPLISGYRGATLALLVIGVAMCAFSSPETARTGSLFITASAALGIGAFILAVYGLLTGAETPFILLTITIVALWIISTVRHMIGG